MLLHSCGCVRGAALLHVSLQGARLSRRRQVGLRWRRRARLFHAVALRMWLMAAFVAAVARALLHVRVDMGLRVRRVYTGIDALTAAAVATSHATAKRGTLRDVRVCNVMMLVVLWHANGSHRDLCRAA